MMYYSLGTRSISLSARGEFLCDILLVCPQVFVTLGGDKHAKDKLTSHLFRPQWLATYSQSTVFRQMNTKMYKEDCFGLALELRILLLC